ncbi:hypothetical protein MMC07_000644 [Pseudocyphellaria aurata]|nr:hypothetical protein [Pseudocyphellaria aurata]
MPFQDFTEPYSDKMSFPNDRVFDFNEIDDLVPNSVDSVAPNTLALNFGSNSDINAKNDPTNQEISNQNSDNLNFNLNVFGPSVQLSDLAPGQPLQPPSPLVLASNSGTDEKAVTIDSTAFDQTLWTVAQNSDPSCRTEDSKQLGTKTIDECPNPNPMTYFRSPPQAQGRKKQRSDRAKRDEKWTSNHPHQDLVDLRKLEICRQYTYDGIPRPLSFCCDALISKFYDKMGWVTNRLNWVLLFVGRPFCEFPDVSWFCCASARDNNPKTTYGWEGISCVNFPQVN